MARNPEDLTPTPKVLASPITQLAQETPKRASTPEVTKKLAARSYSPNPTLADIKKAMTEAHEAKKAKTEADEKSAIKSCVSVRVRV